MKKTLLVISGGIEALPGIRIAKKMGLRVVVSDIDPRAPGFAEADDVIHASTYDVAGTVQAAVQYHKNVGPLHGVICIASDVPLTVASVAEALGLPGIPVEVGRLAMDKLAMKIRFAEDGVPVPWFVQIGSINHLREIVRRSPFPLVLKPVDSRGARGVLRLTPSVDLDWAFGLARGHSPTGRVMVEEFLPGPQVSTESIVLDGTAYTSGFSDRNYEYLERYTPHIIENGGELPSRLQEGRQDAVKRLVQRAVQSMGIRDGVVKGDIVVVGETPYMIELAPRLSGGYFCTHEIPLNTGVEFVKQAIRLAMGERPDPSELLPRYQRGVAQRYLFPNPGRVTRVSGLDKASQHPGIALCEIRVREGDIVAPINSHPGRAGVIIATAESRKEAIARATAAIRDIVIETAPMA